MYCPVPEVSVTDCILISEFTHTDTPAAPDRPDLRLLMEIISKYSRSEEAYHLWSKHALVHMQTKWHLIIR